MINTNSPGCMYLCTWRGFFLPKREILFFFCRSIIDNHTSLRLLLSGKSHIEKVQIQKESTATLRGGILFRLIAILLVKAKVKVKERKKVRRLDGFAR